MKSEASKLLASFLFGQIMNELERNSIHKNHKNVFKVSKSSNLCIKVCVCAGKSDDCQLKPRLITIDGKSCGNEFRILSFLFNSRIKTKDLDDGN